MIATGAIVNVEKAVYAYQSYRLATKKNEATILNKFAKDSALRAASFTKKTSASRIRSSLMKDPHLRYALTSIILRSKGKGILKTPQFAKAVASLVNKRASSAAYLRAAWTKAIQDLGGSVGGQQFQGIQGFANRARAAKLVAEIVSVVAQPDSKHAKTAEQIILQALKKGIDYKLDDMIAYAHKLMGVTAAEHSGKR